MLRPKELVKSRLDCTYIGILFPSILLVKRNHYVVGINDVNAKRIILPRRKRKYSTIDVLIPVTCRTRFHLITIKLEPE